MVLITSFNSADAMRITGATPKQLAVWVQSGMIAPSVRGLRKGKGGKSAHQWSFTDLVGLRAIVELRQAGISLQSLRKVGQFLTALGGSFANTFLLINGADVMIKRGDEIISALQQPGQRALAMVFDLQKTEQEVAEAVKMIRKAA